MNIDGQGHSNCSVVVWTNNFRVCVFRELNIVEHLLFLMSFVVQRNKKRIQLRNLIADERAERSFLNYCMATAHLAKFYQGMHRINEGHLDERFPVKIKFL